MSTDTKDITAPDQPDVRYKITVQTVRITTDDRGYANEVDKHTVYEQTVRVLDIAGLVALVNEVQK